MFLFIFPSLKSWISFRWTAFATQHIWSYRCQIHATQDRPYGRWKHAWPMQDTSLHPCYPIWRLWCPWRSFRRSRPYLNQYTICSCQFCQTASHNVRHLCGSSCRRDGKYCRHRHRPGSQPLNKMGSHSTPLPSSFLQYFSIFKFRDEINATVIPSESHQSSILSSLINGLLDADGERVLTHALDFASLANIDADLIFNFGAELLVGINWTRVNGWHGWNRVRNRRSRGCVDLLPGSQKRIIPSRQLRMRRLCDTPSHIIPFIYALSLISYQKQVP